MNFERRGQGTPLVLIHGVGSRRQIWDPMLDQLAAQHDVVAVDLPGFGSSPSEGKPGTVAGLADQVAGFCADLGLDRPHIAGNSMGGGIALTLAARGLARSATAYSPIGFWSTAELLWTQEALQIARASSKALRPIIPRAAPITPLRAGALALFYGKPWQLSADYLVADAAALRDAGGFAEALESFGDYTPPTQEELAGTTATVAWGSRDALLIHRTQAGRAERRLPDATHVTLVGCGHIPFADDPHACVDVLLATTERAGG